MSRNRRRKQRHLFAQRPEHVAHLQTADLQAPEGMPTRIRVVAYGPERLEESEIASPEEIKQYIGKYPVVWVHVDGLGDRLAIQRIADIFLLHELALEDVFHVQQRAKVELYGELLFVVLRCMELEHGAPSSEQVSAFLGKGFVVSFEEKSGHDVLSDVRERICRAGSHVRQEPADYLLYAIIDYLIDGYFPIAEALGEQLELLEDEIIDYANRSTPARIHELKRAVLSVRRAVWPARDAISVLSRDEFDGLISGRTRMYMRDCYDHAMRIIDVIETQREMCSDLMDLYLSSVSNRMNEVIKVLTIVTLLFMPPTLVAGIYGMNFAIPEYKWKLGYVYALVLMGGSALLVALWAWYRGWLQAVEAPPSKAP